MNVYHVISREASGYGGLIRLHREPANGRWLAVIFSRRNGRSPIDMHEEAGKAKGGNE
jgi:hypothetical protein